MAGFFCHALSTQQQYYIDLQGDKDAAEAYVLLQSCREKERKKQVRVKMK